MTQLAVRKAPRRETPTLWSAECYAAVFDTDLGWMALAHRDGALAGLVFGHASQHHAVRALRRLLAAAEGEQPTIEFVEPEDHPAPIRDLVARLELYAEGEPVDFSDVPIDQRHLTPFGRRIASACRRIPAGETRSYGELAAKCGSPGAARAVGQAMARNRYPLVVPCHRVLAAGGLIGGFSAPQGLAMKRRLLELERQAASAT